VQNKNILTTSGLQFYRHVVSSVDTLRIEMKAQKKI